MMRLTYDTKISTGKKEGHASNDFEKAAKSDKTFLGKAIDVLKNISFFFYGIVDQYCIVQINAFRK